MEWYALRGMWAGTLDEHGMENAGEDHDPALDELEPELGLPDQCKPAKKARLPTVDKVFRLSFCPWGAQSPMGGALWGA